MPRLPCCHRLQVRVAERAAWLSKISYPPIFHELRELAHDLRRTYLHDCGIVPARTVADAYAVVPGEQNPSLGHCFGYEACIRAGRRIRNIVTHQPEITCQSTEHAIGYKAVLGRGLTFQNGIGWFAFRKYPLTRFFRSWSFNSRERFTN